MAEYMKNAVHLDESGKLNDEEQKLLLLSYKQAIRERKNSWRILDSIFESNSSKLRCNGEKEQEIFKQLLLKIETEIVEIAKSIIHLITQNILPNVLGEADEVFYLTSIGIFYQQIAEIFSSNEEERKQSSELAEKNYLNANELATKILKPFHIHRLNLALHYAIYLYEIAKDTTKSISVGTDAFQNAIIFLDEIDKDEKKNEIYDLLTILRPSLVITSDQINEQPNE